MTYSKEIGEAEHISERPGALEEWKKFQQEIKRDDIQLKPSTPAEKLKYQLDGPVWEAEQERAIFEYWNLIGEVTQ